MRLIDADKLIEDMRDKWDMQDLYLPIHFKELLIDEQPTVYNVDKVVEKLEEQISKHDLLFNKYVKDKDKSDSWSISELNKIRGLLEAIDVVKAGEV